MRLKQWSIKKQTLMGLALFFMTVNAYAGDVLERFFNENIYGETLGIILQCAGIYYFCAGIFRLVGVYEGTFNSTKYRCLMTSVAGLCLYYHITFLSVMGNTLGLSI